MVPTHVGTRLEARTYSRQKILEKIPWHYPAPAVSNNQWLFMEDALTLPVAWKGAELDLPLQIVPQGYTYRFIVRVEDTDLTIERDDGGALRALIANADGHHSKLPEQALVAEIVATIEKLLAG